MVVLVVFVLEAHEVNGLYGTMMIRALRFAAGGLSTGSGMENGIKLIFVFPCSSPEPLKPPRRRLIV